MNIGIDARPAMRGKTGVGNYVLYLVRWLAELDRENHYHLFSNSFRDRFHMPVIESRPRWHVHDYRFPNVLMNFLWDRVGGPVIKPFLDGLDVFHFTGNIAPHLKGLATVTTIYDLYHVHYPGSVKPAHRVSAKRLRQNLDSVSRVITISEFTRRDLIGLTGISMDKVTVVPLGVDTDVFQPLERKACRDYLRQRFQLDGDYILFMGTLEARKNLVPLVRAFHRVAARHKGLKLVLSGAPGWGFQQVSAEISALGLEDRVVLAGYMREEKDLRNLYCGALAFVMPSLYEGFGLPLLEAFACGTPVAASNNTAIPEVTAEAALLFDPGQPDDIAEKISRLLEDSALVRSLKEKAQNRVRQFSWQAMAKKTLDVYLSLATDR